MLAMYRGKCAAVELTTSSTSPPGNRWLKPDGSLITAMDGRHGLDKNLKPGEETEVPLQITAPKEPGDYILEVDLVQEQVAWFLDKGSPTAKTKITVVR